MLPANSKIFTIWSFTDKGKENMVKLGQAFKASTKKQCHLCSHFLG